MNRILGGLVVAAVLSGLAGCGQGEPGTRPSPDATPSPTPSGKIGIPSGELPGTPTYPPGKRPVTVTLTRTGGIAGMHDRVEVTPDGAWWYSGSAGKQTGQLTDQQVSKLQSLVLDDRLRAEAKRENTPDCADGFQYTLHAGSLSMTAVDCGRFEDRPVFSKLVDHVVAVTAM